MLHLEESITINKPPAVVFAYLCNLSAIPTWRVDITHVNNISGPATPGTTFEETINFFGRSIYKMRIEKIIPNEQMVIQAITGPFILPTQTFELTSTGTATTLTFKGALKPLGIFKLLAPLLKPALRKKWQQYLRQLKQNLESTIITKHQPDEQALDPEKTLTTT